MGLKKKILLVYTGYSTFIKTDYEILSSKFDVSRYRMALTKGILNLVWCLLKQTVFLLFNAWKYDVFFIWFADYHAFLPVFFARLFHKKSLLVNGGYDVVRLQELNYGVFCSKVRGFFAAYSMKKCSLNLPVSNFVARKVKAITHKENYQVIYNCVNLSVSLPEILPEREYVLTVGLIDTERTYLLKGIDTFVEVARLLPQIPFLIVGLNVKKLHYLTVKFPPNIRVFEALSHNQLAEFYLKAKVYCQFSRSESFGVALAEAMHYGCIPFVTKEGGMPEVVGKEGFIQRRDTNSIMKMIEIIFYTAKIVNNFSINETFSFSKRKEKLLQVLSG